MPVTTASSFRFLFFSDDFESYSLGSFAGGNSYTDTSDPTVTATIEPGQFLRHTATTNTQTSTGSFVLNRFKAVNYSIRVKIRLHETGANEQGLVNCAKIAGTDNIQVRIFQINAAYRLFVSDTVGGTTTTLANIPFAGAPNTWYVLKYTMIGSTVDATVFDETETSQLATTNVTTTVQAGNCKLGILSFMGTDGGVVDFDDFSVRAL